MLDVTVPKEPERGADRHHRLTHLHRRRRPQRDHLKLVGGLYRPSLGISSATSLIVPLVAGHWASDRRLVCPLWRLQDHLTVI